MKLIGRYYSSVKFFESCLQLPVTCQLIAVKTQWTQFCQWATGSVIFASIRKYRFSKRTRCCAPCLREQRVAGILFFRSMDYSRSRPARQLEMDFGCGLNHNPTFRFRMFYTLRQPTTQKIAPLPFFDFYKIIFFFYLYNKVVKWLITDEAKIRVEISQILITRTFVSRF